MLIVLFALCGVVILLIVVLLQAWFYNWKVDLVSRASRRDRRLQETPAAIAKSQLQRIETYGWVDLKTKKDRTIPIDRAMELVAKEFAAPATPGKETGDK